MNVAKEDNSGRVFRSWFRTEHLLSLFPSQSPSLTGGLQWFTHRLLPTFQVVRVSERLTNLPVDSVLSQWGLRTIEKVNITRKCQLAQSLLIKPP
jgi:hypothetical protein